MTLLSTACVSPYFSIPLKQCISYRSWDSPRSLKMAPFDIVQWLGYK